MFIKIDFNAVEKIGVIVVLAPRDSKMSLYKVQRISKELKMLKTAV
jgi:hypothetical protein